MQYIPYLMSSSSSSLTTNAFEVVRSGPDLVERGGHLTSGMYEHSVRPKVYSVGSGLPIEDRARDAERVDGATRGSAGELNSCM